MKAFSGSLTTRREGIRGLCDQENVTHATSGHNGEDNALTVGLSPKVAERSRSLDMHSAWPRVMIQLKGSFKTIDNRFMGTMDTPRTFYRKVTKL